MNLSSTVDLNRVHYARYLHAEDIKKRAHHYRLNVFSTSSCHLSGIKVSAKNHIKVDSEKKDGFTIYISMASAPEMVTQPSFTSAVRQALMWHVSWC